MIRSRLFRIFLRDATTALVVPPLIMVAMHFVVHADLSWAEYSRLLSFYFIGWGLSFCVAQLRNPTV